MNPFNQVQKNIQKSYSIKLWKEKGKKTNTFLTGWLDSKDELLFNHKKYKKRKDDDEEKLFFHLQGDRVYELTNYLKEQGIDENDIEIIG